MHAIGRVFLVVALASLLAFGTFGMLDMSMGMQMDGTMSHCLFSPAAAVCTMTPSAHIASSQSFFTTIVTYGDVFMLLTLLSFASYAMSVFWKLQVPPLVCAYVCRRGKESASQSSLQEAFSSGILNPKLF